MCGFGNLGISFLGSLKKAGEYSVVAGELLDLETPCEILKNKFGAVLEKNLEVKLLASACHSEQSLRSS